MDDEDMYLEVSDAALMYSDIRHLLGIIEGAAMGIKNAAIAGAIFNSCQLLTEIVDELYGIEPEYIDGEDEEDAE